MIRIDRYYNIPCVNAGKGPLESRSKLRKRAVASTLTVCPRDTTFRSNKASGLAQPSKCPVHPYRTVQPTECMGYSTSMICTQTLQVIYFKELVYIITRDGPDSLIFMDGMP